MRFEELSNWTVDQLTADIKKGGKFVIFTYTISIIFMTFRRPSDLFYIKSDEIAISNGFGYLFISLLLGWWGFPWGPIYTIQSIWYAFVGKDVTEVVMHDILKNMQNDAPNYYDVDKLMQ